jgi:hypothetical protein
LSAAIRTSIVSVQNIHSQDRTGTKTPADKKPEQRKLLDFFGTKQRAPRTAHQQSSSSALRIEGSSGRNRDTAIDVDGPPSPSKTKEDPTSHVGQPKEPDSLEKLLLLSQTLPTPIPEAGPEDILAAFMTDPSSNVAPGTSSDQVWEEVINPLLHRLFWQADDDELASRVRRGTSGISALYWWINICVQKLGIPMALFEERIDRMNCVMLKL